MNYKDFRYFEDYLIKMVMRSGKIISGLALNLPNEEKKFETEFSFVEFHDVDQFLEAFNKKNKKILQSLKVRMDAKEVVSVVHLNYEGVINDIRNDIHNLSLPEDHLRIRITAKIIKLIIANFGGDSPFLNDLNKKQESYPQNKFYGFNSMVLNKTVLKSYKKNLNELLDSIEAALNSYSNYSMEAESLDPDDNSPVLNGIPDFTDDKEKVSEVRDKTVRYQKKQQKRKTEVHVLIASPRDVTEARNDLMNKLETQFRRNGFEEICGIRIIVHGWEELASQTGHPQSIINNDLVKKVDIIVAVFKHVLGTPVNDPDTGKVRSESGTAEELLYAIHSASINKKVPLGMAYFDNNGPTVSVESVDFEKIVNEWKRLKEFRHKIKDKIMYKTYSEERDLLNLVCADLYQNIQNKFKQPSGKRHQYLN